MFTRFRERWLRLRAEWVSPRLAYWVALRVLAHSAVTAQADVPASEIKAMDALDHWRDSMILHEPARRRRSLLPPLWDRSRLDGDIQPRDDGPPILSEEEELERLTAPTLREPG